MVPDLVFLSEPQLFQCDAESLTSMLRGKYCYNLNSEDIYCPELPLTARKAHGGTMVLWKQELDPHIRVLPTTSAAVLPLLLAIPGVSRSAHIAVYLPTAGKDSEFISALAALECALLDIYENHACPVYLRGDFNVNPKNRNRVNLLQQFLEKYSLSSLDFGHPTHHHFTGEGRSDSQLDLILFSGPALQSEILLSVVCSLANPLVQSNHDLILSSFLSPSVPLEAPSGKIIAPKVSNDRVKVKWKDDDIPAFQALVSPSLEKLRELWPAPAGPASFSLLLSATNLALNRAAKSTQVTSSLAVHHKQRPSYHPEVRAAQKETIEALKYLRSQERDSDTNYIDLAATKSRYTAAKSRLKALTRSWQHQEALKRDLQLSSVLESNPTALYSFLRSSKAGSFRDIQNLSVEGKTYTGPQVPDGFFDSLSSLKSPPMEDIRSSDSFKTYDADYQHIIKICRSGLQIPNISGRDALLLLHSLRPNVNDLYSITASHYINAGMEGVRHFCFLLNTIISNINFSSVDLLNSVWAMVLFKGHGKDRESDRSYRTISTCPLLSKALDKYVGRLFESGWASAQAETQFQGNGSSHELAALLLTETIQHSLFVQFQPVFVLFLDAKSAFDKILRELVIRAAFLAGSRGEGLIFLDNRLKNRKTFVEWNKVLMGPILDKLGVEQGGINSDRLYKLANNVELLLTQKSGLGVHLGPVHVASVGQADDVALVSNCIFKLQGLLHLAMEYASAYHVTMVPEKTKLLCYTPKGQQAATAYWQTISPISMSDNHISFSRQADHVGILRCIDPGTMAAVLARVTAHTRALHAVLPAGLARGHRGNPAASLKIEQLYGLPVLLSGLGSLVLGKPELDALDHHHKVTLERLLRLYPGTPAPVVYLLAGCPPARATLHLRQLSLLGMVARLGPTTILHRLGVHILNNPPPVSRSPSSMLWFVQVRQICSQYHLPDPLEVLSEPPTKGAWKAATLKAVLCFWGTKLRADANLLPSLSHMRATHMSLSSPSPLLTSCTGNSHEVRKATIQIRMLSGRYRTCWLRRHWSGDNSGACRVPGCSGVTPGTLLHLATGECPGLTAATAQAASHWSDFVISHPHLLPLLQEFAEGEKDTFLSFLLDPTTQPTVIALAQTHGQEVIHQVCMLTRTWLYLHHRARFRALGLWEALI